MAMAADRTDREDHATALAVPAVCEFRVLEGGEAKGLVERVLDQPAARNTEVRSENGCVGNHPACPQTLEIELRPGRREEAHDRRHLALWIPLDRALSSDLGAAGGVQMSPEGVRVRWSVVAEQENPLGSRGR